MKKLYTSLISIAICFIFFFTGPSASFAAPDIEVVVKDQEGNRLPNVRVCRYTSGIPGDEFWDVAGWWCVKTQVDGAAAIFDVEEADPVKEGEWYKNPSRAGSVLTEQDIPSSEVPDAFAGVSMDEFVWPHSFQIRQEREIPLRYGCWQRDQKIRVIDSDYPDCRNAEEKLTEIPGMSDGAKYIGQNLMYYFGPIRGEEEGNGRGNGDSIARFEITCETSEPVKEQASSSTDIEEPSDVGLAETIEWACIQARGCAGGQTSTEEEEEGEGAEFTQDPDNAERGFCTPEAQKEENAAYTVVVPGISNQMQRNSLRSDGIDAWVLQCFNEPTGAEGETEVVCTTGSSVSDQAAVDAGVLQTANWDYLNQTYGVTTTVYGIYTNPEDNAVPVREEITFPLNSQNEESADIADDIEWETRFNDISIVPDEMKDYFFLFAFPQQGDRRGQQGETYSQNQGTLNAQTSCSLIQDPYGTVFDSYTLEPLPDASVELLKDKGGAYVPVTQRDAPAVTKNPLITTENGSYAFFVPDGRYKLDVTREGYTFPAKSSNLNPSYDQFYADIYQGEDIVQHGEIEHRDVPLDPINPDEAKAFAEQNEIKMISLLQSVDRQRDMHVIQGRVTHPKAKISVYGKRVDSSGGFKVTRELKRAEADMDGRFTVEIPLETLEQGEIVGEVEAVKRNVTPRTAGIFDWVGHHLARALGRLPGIFSVQAEGEKVRQELEPILNTVQGYAKDISGSTIPNALVKVYVPMSDSPVSVTTADAAGYYQIPSSELPNIEYRIAYESPDGKTVQASTRRFLSQNAEYVREQDVNVYAYTQPQTRAVMGVQDTSEPTRFENVPVVLLASTVLGILVVSSVTMMGLYAYRHNKSQKKK